MTVLICNDTPPAIRGHLKRWFIEPKPNVFVGTLNVRTHRKVMDYILRNTPKEFGGMAITSAPNCQGYEMERLGDDCDKGKTFTTISGIELIIDKKIETPF